ncbi:MAG: hypothetical protein U0892_22080 [Pirellulales bacterium]
MKNALLLGWISSVVALCSDAAPLFAQQLDMPNGEIACAVLLEHDEHTSAIAVHAPFGSQSHAEAWNTAVDDLFTFADVNADGRIDNSEVRLVPSARSMSKVLSSGFAPPITPIAGVEEIIQGADRICDRDALKTYYKRHRVTGIQAGTGRMPQGIALGRALIQAFDANHNGIVLQEEMDAIEQTLYRLDANDDEMIGAGELLPDFNYPGCSAADRLHSEQSRKRVSDGKRSVEVGFCSSESAKELRADDHLTFPMVATEAVNPSNPMRRIGDRLVVQVWNPRGSLDIPDQDWNDELFFSGSARRGRPTPEPDNAEQQLSWTVSCVDRDGDQMISTDEKQAWIDVQRKLARTQWLISIYAGGGLFELLDRNHDAALSLRELRNAWQVLKAVGIDTSKGIRIEDCPEVVSIVLSRGTVTSFALRPETKVDWFEAMDRNRDGDISRREFTGTTESFSQVDTDGDGLISYREATITL